MPAPKNQGQCGSCWTFSATDVTDFYGGSHSEQQVLDCTPKGNSGCSGGVNIYALQYVASAGAMSESSYPYKASKGSCAYNKAKVTG